MKIKKTLIFILLILGILTASISPLFADTDDTGSSTVDTIQVSSDGNWLVFPVTSTYANNFSFIKWHTNGFYVTVTATDGTSLTGYLDYPTSYSSDVWIPIYVGVSDTQKSIEEVTSTGFPNYIIQNGGTITLVPRFDVSYGTNYNATTGYASYTEDKTELEVAEVMAYSKDGVSFNSSVEAELLDRFQTKSFAAKLVPATIKAIYWGVDADGSNPVQLHDEDLIYTGTVQGTGFVSKTHTLSYTFTDYTFDKSRTSTDGSYWGNEVSAASGGATRTVTVDSLNPTCFINYIFVANAPVVIVTPPAVDTGTIYRNLVNVSTGEVFSTLSSITDIDLPSSYTVNATTPYGYTLDGASITYTSSQPSTSSRNQSATSVTASLSSTQMVAYAWFYYTAIDYDDPVAKITGDSWSYANETLTLDGASSYDPDGGEIWGYSWTAAGATKNTNGTYCWLTYPTTGTYTVYLTVYDDEGAEGMTSRTISVIEPTPTARITQTGTLKELRKITIDSASSTTPKGTLDTTKTTWTISAVSGGTASDIYYSGSLTGVTTKDFLVKKAGSYKVTLTVWNSLGYSNTTTATYTVIADVVPIADFSVPTTLYRDYTWSSTGVHYGKIPVTNLSYSTDGDTIGRVVLYYRTDMDNDGDYADEAYMTLYDSNTNPTNSNTYYTTEWVGEKLYDAASKTFYLVYPTGNQGYTDTVGKKRFDIHVEETLDSSNTISAFITSSDTRMAYTYGNLTTTSDMVCEKGNIAPNASLTGEKVGKPIDIVVLTDYSGTDLTTLTSQLGALKQTGYSNDMDINYNIISDKRDLGRYIDASSTGYTNVSDSTASVYEVANWNGLTEYSNNTWTFSMSTHNCSTDITQASSGTFPSRVKKSVQYNYHDNYSSKYLAKVWLLENGDVYFAGTNSRCDRNTSSTSNFKLTPTKILSNIMQLEGGDDKYFMLSSDGSVYLIGLTFESYYRESEANVNVTNEPNFTNVASLVGDSYGYNPATTSSNSGHTNLMSGYYGATLVKNLSSVSYIYSTGSVFVAKKTDGTWYGLGAGLNAFGLSTGFTNTPRASLCSFWSDSTSYFNKTQAQSLYVSTTEYYVDTVNILTYLANLTSLNATLGGISKVEPNYAYASNGTKYYLKETPTVYLGDYSFTGTVSLPTGIVYQTYSSSYVGGQMYYKVYCDLQVSASSFTYSYSDTWSVPAASEFVSAGYTYDTTVTEYWYYDDYYNCYVPYGNASYYEYITSYTYTTTIPTVTYSEIPAPYIYTPAYSYDQQVGIVKYWDWGPDVAVWGQVSYDAYNSSSHTDKYYTYGPVTTTSYITRYWAYPSEWSWYGEEVEITYSQYISGWGYYPYTTSESVTTTANAYTYYDWSIRNDVITEVSYDYFMNSWHEERYTTTDYVWQTVYVPATSVTSGWHIYAVDPSKISSSSFRSNATKYILYIAKDNSFKGVNSSYLSLAATNNASIRSASKATNLDLKLTSTDISARQFISSDPYSKIYTESQVDTLLQDIYYENYVATTPSNEVHVLINEESVTYNTGYSDYEADAQFCGLWRYYHTPTYYENNTGTASFSGQWQWSPITNFTQSGKYAVLYNAVDTPISQALYFALFEGYRKYSADIPMTIYAHRRPTAQFEIAFTKSGTAYTTETINQSYDTDWSSLGLNALSESYWQWRVSGATTWTTGTFPTTVTAGVYEVALKVKDTDGAWSTPVTKTFDTNNLPPTVDASPTSYTGTAPITVFVTSDDNGENDYYYTNLAWSTSVVKPTSGWNTYQAKLLGPTNPSTGTYYLHMEVFDTSGQSFYRYRGPYKVDTMPTIDASPTSYTGTAATLVTVTASDNGENDYYLTQLCWSTSTTKPTSGWSNYDSKILTPTTPSSGTYYLHMIVYDTAGNSFYRYRGPYTVESLKITGVNLTGYWNHWRGQIDLFGKQMTTEPHRFLSLEKVKIDVSTTGGADKVIIRFSPELEAMTFTNELGHTYDYNADFFGYDVPFPENSTITLDTAINDNTCSLEYSLPLAPSTVGWDDVRIGGQYTMTVTAYKGTSSVTYTVSDIDITGNIYDLTYIQPI